MSPLPFALLLAATTAATADRRVPPTPGPPRPLALPAVQKSTLGNGLPVWVVEQREVPVVHVLLSIRSGAASDALEHAGLAAMTADMLDEGAGGKGALEIAEAAESLGAELGTGASWDASFASIHVPVKRLEPALELLATIALQPDFPDAELTRLRREALTGLLQMRNEPGPLASVALAKALFPGHRYGTSDAGDARSLSALTTSDLKAFHARHYRPANATLIVVGDIGAADVKPLLERTFGAWPSRPEETKPAALARPAAAVPGGIWLVDRPGSAQSVVRIGRPGPERATPDYHVLEVMNTILGGSFTSRLNDNLRETHGYAYGAASRFTYRRVGGTFLAAADVHTPATAPAVREMVKEIDRMAGPLPPADLERGRNLLAMSYAEDFETTRQIASQLAALAVYGLPDDTFATHVPRLLAVKADAVRRAARQHAPSSGLTVVVVGDRATVEGPLKQLGLGPVRNISVEELLGAPPAID